MALILNIDTAGETASVCLSGNGKRLAYKQHGHQKEHAAFVHAAVQEIIKETGVSLKSIDAFAVTSGPGSYTGLRVSMAAAKGFCYALSKPMIAINTLEVMASAAIETVSENLLFCPMIDARRMEIFTAIYDKQLNVIMSPQSLILDSSSFENYLAGNTILFSGSGSDKFKDMQQNKNSKFSKAISNAFELGRLAEKSFNEGKFADVIYAQPDYLKDVHLVVK